MSLYIVDFSSDDEDGNKNFQNATPFKPKFNVPDEKAKPKYLQETNRSTRRMRNGKDATKVEKKVVEYKPEVLTEQPAKASENRRTRKKEIITFEDADSSDDSYTPDHIQQHTSESEDKNESNEEKISFQVTNHPQQTAQPHSRRQVRGSSPHQQVQNSTSPQVNTENESTKPNIENEVKTDQKEQKPQENQTNEIKRVQQPELLIYVPRPSISDSKAKEQPMYRISREKKTGLLGATYTFRFYMLSEFILSAIYKKGADTINIIKEGSSDVDACISIGNKTQDFSLRLGSKTGDEVLSIRFYPKEGKNLARRMSVSFFIKKEGNPAKLFSRQPTESVQGHLTYNFNGRFHIQSVKNAVLFEKKGDPDLFWIRKIANEVIELQAAFPLEPLSMFAIGLASFITEIK